jgi:hypothetical protein
MRADDEHHQCEPNIGQQREGRVGVIDDPKARLSDHQPGDQLADDHRDPESRHRGAQRPGHPYDRKQRQCVEAEPRHFGGLLPGHQMARNVGIFVGEIARAHPVIAVGDLQRIPADRAASHEQIGEIFLPSLILPDPP